jgi:hypothetical protein
MALFDLTYHRRAYTFLTIGIKLQMVIEMDIDQVRRGKIKQWTK